MSDRFETQLRVHGLCLDGALFSLPSPSDHSLRFPQQGINLLYGKNFQEGLRFFLSGSAMQGGSSEIIELSFLGYRPGSEKNWSGDFRDKNIFDLRQLSTSVKKWVADLFREYLHQYNKPYTSMSDKEVIELHPFLLDRLKSEPEFSEVDCFIWPLSYETGQFALATLFKKPEMLSFQPSQSKISVPRWLE